MWFITGASRGMGVEFAKAALAVGDGWSVATGRNPDAVRTAVGQAEDLLVARLDVTSRRTRRRPSRPRSTDSAGSTCCYNAANFYGGYFEELTPTEIQDQLATGLIGPMNVTRAVLPVMRQQRSGHIMSISSGAGLAGFECYTYCAAKFGMEGWMEPWRPTGGSSCWPFVRPRASVPQ